MKQQIKLSIVIPCYNCQNYLKVLLDILHKQVNEKVQIIVIDDGSDIPINSNYDWVELYRKENGGVSSARNYGIDKVKGEYLTFIDSDDIVSNNYISTILKKIDEENFDYCYMSWKSFGNWNQVVELKTVYDKFPEWNLCCWNRVYKFNLVKDIRFNEKKHIAEDAEYIRFAEEKCHKKSVISNIIYYYRSDTPNSLTKKFNNGELDTQRIVYYYEKITSDMKYLIEEIKELDKEAEVIIMTNYNEIKELSNYAMVIRPTQIKGTELRGNYTALFAKIMPPLETQVVIWTSKTFEIGGIETFIYNFCMQMKDDYDITVLYSEMDTKQIQRLQPYVRVEKNDGQIIKCNSIIVNRITDLVPDNIKYNQKIQMVHSCKLMNNWIVPKNNDFVIPVSQPVYKSYKDEIDLQNHRIINNFTNDINPKKVLRLISATRLSFEKGEDRMIKFAKLLEENNIPYIWTIFSSRPLKEMCNNVVYLNPTLDIADYIADNDYLVQLSDSEAFCYSIVESLQLGTPVITTPIDVLNEIGVIDDKNGFIVPFNMENIDINKIYNSNLKFEYKYDNLKIKKEWKNILGNTIPKHDYDYEEEKSKKISLKISKKYRDTFLNRIVLPGEIINIPIYRANKLISMGFGSPL